MKICIIVFSPSGHTLAVAETMKSAMENYNMDVQLINITGEKRVFKENALKEYLNTEVNPHDILCIGGPVYAGHLESNVKKIIKSLPDVDGNWGRLAIPFVTYGGLHSSIALKEAGDLLYRRGRNNVMGMKITCFHTLSATLEKQVNQGKPGKEAQVIVNELVTRVKQLSIKSKFVDVRKSFAYASPREKMIFSLLSQDFLLKKYRISGIDPKKCTGCGICVHNCPVNIIEIENKKAIAKEVDRCILCAECFHKCPSKAVNYPYYNNAKSRLERTKKYEYPESAVYPINKEEKEWKMMIF